MNEQMQELIKDQIAAAVERLQSRMGQLPAVKEALERQIESLEAQLESWS
jgi:hypothetical protein